MDFNIRKPSHLFVMLMILFSFVFIIIFPVVSYFNFLPVPQDPDETPGSNRLIFEFLVLMIQIAFVMVLMVFFPLIWYFVVNRLSIKETLSRLNLRLEGVDTAVLWGVVTAISLFVIVTIFTSVLIQVGYEPEELSNIPDLQRYFSLPSLFFLVAIQPVGEEIFFRGFLLEKINTIAGKNVAILGTGLLFGLAHMSYGKVYPIIMPIVMGILLGAIVLKTKNLYSAITAHIIFNLTSFMLYILAQSLISESLIL